MNHNKRNIMLTLAALVVLFGLACFVQAEVDSYIRRIVNLCLIYAIIGLSMNVTNGFAGQFSLGQAGFMAIGAYMVGIFTVPVELRADVFYAIPMNPHLVNVYMPLWMALILGGVLAAGIAGLIGTPVLRLRGDYLAIATLGFSEIYLRLLGDYPHHHHQRHQHHQRGAGHQEHSAPERCTVHFYGRSHLLRAYNIVAELFLRPGFQGHPGR